MNTISIFGSWWGGNLGDTAILKSTIRTIRRQTETEHLFLVHSSNPGELSKYFDKFDNIEIRRTRNNYWGTETVRSLTESDAIIVGGGGLFFSNHSYNPQRNHLINLAPVSILSTLLVKDCHVLSVGASHLDGVVPGMFAKIVLESAMTISARDEVSEQTLSRYTSKEVTQVPDPAFTLTPVESEEVEQITAELPSKTLLLSLHDGITRNHPDLDRRECVESILDHVGKYAVAHDYDIALYNNYVFSDWLFEWSDRFDQDVTVHTIKTNGLQPEEVISLLTHFERAVCSQMHVNIFSMLAGTPNVALRYDEKVRSVMELVSRESQVVELDQPDSISTKLKTCEEPDPTRLRELRDNFKQYITQIC
jgi:polysaccharide pyruvyl transferase WcaK-like protein